jgi:hypothetical protein
MGEAWTVLDAHRMAFFSTEADVWSADDFSRLADAAGLVVGDAVDRPRGTRPDAVDLSTIAAPGWKVGLAVVVPVIALVILIAVLKAVL